MSPPRFSRRGALARYGRIALLLALAWTTLETLYVRWAMVRREHAAIAPFGKEKIFITSIHWNDEYILRAHWMAALEAVALEIGASNVFVSVYESGSYDDDTKGALRELDARLGEAGIPREVLTDDTTHADIIARARPPSEQGWIDTTTRGSMPRRIPYLADLRNKALQPLYEQERRGVRYDKILFLNDVVFRAEDVRELLSTRGGKYAAACALDFAHPPAFYDTFAIRDTEGHEAVMQTWPYFRSSRSRSQVMAHQPVAVESCWNGMVFMDAQPFYPHPKEQLDFRGIPDALAEFHLEGSECCLIHVDNHLSATEGVWVNPKVRVGYTPAAYEAVHPASSTWISVSDIVRGIWVNRLRRWTTTTWFSDIKIRGRVAKWRPQTRGARWPGEECLVDEMQVLVANGWAHV